MHHHREHLRNNLRLGMIEGILATPWVFISMPASFLVAALITEYYGIDPGLYGVIASLPAWCNAAQILLVPAMARHLNGRDLSLGMSWLNLGLWFMFIIFLGLVPEFDAARAGMLFLLFFLASSITSSFIGVGWTSWVQDWVPQRLRGKYFGVRNRAVHFVTVAYLALAMLLLYRNEDNIWPYLTLLGLAVATRFISVVLQHGIRTPGADASPLVHARWLSQLVNLRHQRSLVLYIIFATWVGFWLSGIGPFVPVFVFTHLQLTPFDLSLLVIIATLSAALMTPVWGRVADRHGVRTVLVLSVLIWQLQDYLWVVVSPDKRWLLYPMWLVGGGSASGFFLGSFLMLLKLVPPSARAAGVSAHLALTSVASGVAPVLMGILLDRFPDANNSLFVYRIAFAAKPSAILLGLLLIHKLHEPSGGREQSILGAMRTMRQMMLFNGFYSLLNMTSTFRGLRSNSRRQTSSKNH